MSGFKLECVSVVASLHELTDGITAIVRDLKAARDAALNDALGRLDELARQANAAGIPFIPGNYTDALEHMVGARREVIPDEEDNSESEFVFKEEAPLTITEIATRLSDDDWDWSYSDEDDDEDGGADEWDFESKESS